MHVARLAERRKAQALTWSRTGDQRSSREIVLASGRSPSMPSGTRRVHVVLRVTCVPVVYTRREDLSVTSLTRPETAFRL